MGSKAPDPPPSEREGADGNWSGTKPTPPPPPPRRSGDRYRAVYGPLPEVPEDQPAEPVTSEAKPSIEKELLARMEAFTSQLKRERDPCRPVWASMKRGERLARTFAVLFTWWFAMGAVAGFLLGRFTSG